jgi:hypothetical protein
MPLSPPDIPKLIGTRKLSLKDRRFLDYYLQGKPLWQCEKHAGSMSKNRQSLAVAGYGRLKKLNIEFDQLLEIKGLSDNLLAEKLKEGLNSTRFNFATFRGKITDTLETPDFSARAKFAELLGKAKGRFRDVQEHTGKDGGDIILQVIPPRRATDRKEIDL